MNNHLRCKYFLYSLVLSGFLAGCFSPTVTNTPPTNTRLPTITQMNTPLPPTKTATVTPVKTITPSSSFTSSPTLTRTPTVTWTAIPTLSDIEAGKMVIDLLKNNGGCKLPCWWGFLPDETQWVTARHFLRSFTKIIELVGFDYEENNSIKYEVKTYSVYYPVTRNKDDGVTGFKIKNGIIDLIRVEPVGLEYSYQLQQILSEYGIPDEVNMMLLPPYMNSDIYLFLFYRYIGILAFYDIQTTTIGSEIRGCPQGIGPNLWLWSPENHYSIDDVAPLGPGPNQEYMKPIKDITGMDIVTFYKIYKEPGNTECILATSDEK